MKNFTLLGLATLLLSSCADKKDDDEVIEPVKEPTVAKKTPAPSPPAVSEIDPTAMFLTPKHDRNLPNSDQLAEGSDSSIRILNPTEVTANDQPSTSVKPPSIPGTEDQLAPPPAE